ncbi:VOC family protein [Shimia sp. Alg240-R146]|uniref:VOC family protein n=1 Tax=Shimia sp. Alg240-R146 TaxID=2993449 RepID=UPI0022E7E627|nr:VOC family protein [Shimia sp. Alg240-R146]
MELDHLAVAGESLEEAVAHVEEALGVAMGPGGQHAHFGTHNQLIGLGDGLYLEAIAVDPAVGELPYARWFDLDRFEGVPKLGNWICRSDDLVADVAAIELDVGQPVKLTRGGLRWRMAVPKSGVLPFEDCFPALMQWDVSPTPATLLAPSGCTLVRLEVAHPDAARLHDAVPVRDARVVYVEGAAGLRATFDTPHGQRVLQ